MWVAYQGGAMTIQTEGRHLADLLDESIEQGGMFLSPSDCELAARALRWFALIADRISDRLADEDEVPHVHTGSSSTLHRLS
jgi:hypothetical protein